MLDWLRSLINIVCLGCLTAAPTPALEPAAAQANSLSGMILLQVEQNGEAWYVNPADNHRYFLNRPADAFAVMQHLGLGATHAFITGHETFPDRVAGRILLDVEANGEAYYIYPSDRRKHYLGRPADAFRIMRELSLGITDADLAALPVGELQINAVDGPLPAQVRHDVPFAAQAPFGDWDDPRQQDGCEEAAALMAVRWARGESLTRAEALAEITAAADYQAREWNEFRDTSARDTLERIVHGYFAYEPAYLRENVTIADMKRLLADGNVIIAPFNGQLLHNPYFTPPGPIRHAAVITGYDDEADEFITNDPGTRSGEDFRYPTATLFAAMRDYPSGYHEPIERLDKTIIVVPPAAAN